VLGKTKIKNYLNKLTKQKRKPMNEIRNQIFAFRTTRDFTGRFDELCERLGFNRSEVVRFALKEFLNTNFNNAESFKRVRKQMY
jgi:hypothetical protein